MAASPAPPSAAAAADGGIEENAMAILDSSGIKDSRDLHDDRVVFLETVRSACLAADNPSAPSWRMYDAVFQILRNSSSLELAALSFHLLMELGKQYPRTYLKDSSAHQDLVVVKESWSPFLLGNDAVCGEFGANARSSDHRFDPSKFSLLIEDMVEPINGTDVHSGIKAVENMMVFQYLVNTLEADFLPRHIAYKESRDWVIFRESLLNMLLGSRKLVFTSFVKNCIYLLLNQYHHEATDAVEDSIPSERDSAKSASDLDSSLNLLSFESERAHVSLRKLFVMVMNLDLIRKEADTLGRTSRADGFRNPIMEVILDELTYNTSYLSPFLLAFVEWKWKLEIILQYFSKYCGKVFKIYSSPQDFASLSKSLMSQVALHQFKKCLLGPGVAYEPLFVLLVLVYANGGISIVVLQLAQSDLSFRLQSVLEGQIIHNWICSSMATLTFPPTAAAGQAAQESLSDGIKKPADEATDPTGMDSGWVVLGKSDIVPADLAAAAAAAGHRRLGFSPLPMIPIWAQMVLGGVVYTVVPFYKRARKVEDETLDNVETAAEVVEHVAEVTEKLAANVATSLPEDGSLQKVAVEVEYVAEVVDEDAHKVEAVIKKIEEVSDLIDAAVEPVIEELEKDFKPNPTSSSGSDAQK